MSVKGLDLNVRDRFDATPLYLAALCGHTEVVKFCQDNEVSCEEGTEDGSIALLF